MIAVHVFKNSPQRPNARFSIYLQRCKRGFSWRRKDGVTGMNIWIRHYGRWDHIRLRGGR